ncbi:MAG: glycine cleavage system aminomethyltransferase GcvT [Verrucomicrobiota bacterium]|nr:glycine cleavage system aminomethyltransferase GcvT [Chthoniobacterales bacterium]MDQ3413799.1 glycine cleavage system aminomethyltransferase GcvT [Verrucomicrobiota bacterium]
MSAAASKTTPLYDQHLKLGAKIIPFGGWLMPVQYSSIMEEHLAVRNAVGMFDISHMGELVASGPRAGEWLNTMLTNNVAKLEVGTGQYTFLLNDEAGIIDDLILYRIEDEKFLLVVNASRIEDDFEWLRAHLPGSATPATAEVRLENQSDRYAGLAVQGPKIGELFAALFGEGKELPARNQIAQFDLGGTKLWIARTGYTGEDGIELFFPAADAAPVWNQILENGKSLGIRPCGLGARDTLRLEMCYPLNGSDLSPEHHPLEAGLGFFVDLTKPQFTGREKLLREKRAGLSRRLVPFRMKGKSPPPRPHYKVFRDGEAAGELTSGTLSPSLNYGIGMAYLTTPAPKPGEEIEIEIRGQKFPAVIEKKPLYKKP